MALPCIGRNFESLQLSQDLECGALTLHLRFGRDMLPSQQPAHELRRSHRLHLLAKRSHSEAMNAGEQAAVAPFDFGINRRAALDQTHSTLSFCSVAQGKLSEGARSHTVRGRP